MFPALSPILPRRALPWRACSAVVLALAATLAMAADEPPVTPSGDKLAAARTLIAQNKWVAAIDELKRVNDSRSADWNNLMGYSHRMARTPDYAAAERYYDAALRIDARHKGALEYSGELYLRLGDLPRAQARLGALQGVCGTDCAEFKDLKAEIERFVANGNRYVPR